ncbi:MAG: hypothetical protein HY698_05985 [Deltaproteobacteria bacterium]|nr:hypothetical protein [Deltaproteobacteria bacterium]
MNIRMASLLIACGMSFACTGSDRSNVDGSVADARPTSTPDAGGIDAAEAKVTEPVAPWNRCSDEDTPPHAMTVVAHDRVDQYWSGWEAGQNRRSVDTQAQFPSTGSWQRVLMRVDLECPADGKCDFWDRGASVSLVEKVGDKEQPIELARYMTPYRVGLCFAFDVTDFSSRLVGTKTVRSFIDTWVGPTHSQGHGWRVTTKFVFYPGTKDRAAFADEVIPLWNNQAEDRLIDLGDPSKPIDKELPERQVSIPSDAKAVKLRFLVTGHGQGNLANCAEFCRLTHKTTLGESDVALAPWRNDCATNPLTNQSGTWQHDRAGWCPGALVAPEVVDVSAQVKTGSTVAFRHQILDDKGSDYVNSCRPGAGGTENLCQGCAFNSNKGNCDYDWSLHSAPYARFSAQLLVYR